MDTKKIINTSSSEEKKVNAKKQSSTPALKGLVSFNIKLRPITDDLTKLTDAQQEMNNELFNDVAKDEGYKKLVYDDGTGIPTIGYGHNLFNNGYTKKDINSTLQEAKITLSEDELKKLEEIGKKLQKGKVAEAKKLIADTKWTTSIKDDEARALFNVDANQKRKELKSHLDKYKKGLYDKYKYTKEIAVLENLAYNGGTGLIGKGLMSALDKGNRAEIVYEIAYNSNGPKNAAGVRPGLANRYYGIADSFGLFNDPNNIKPQEIENINNVYKKNKTKIDSYSKEFTYDRYKKDKLKTFTGRIDTIANNIKPEDLKNLKKDGKYKIDTAFKVNIPKDTKATGAQATNNIKTTGVNTTNVNDIKGTDINAPALNAIDKKNSIETDIEKNKKKSEQLLNMVKFAKNDNEYNDYAKQYMQQMQHVENLENDFNTLKMQELEPKPAIANYKFDDNQRSILANTLQNEMAFIEEGNKRAGQLLNLVGQARNDEEYNDYSNQYMNQMKLIDDAQNNANLLKTFELDPTLLGEEDKNKVKRTLLKRQRMLGQNDFNNYI